MTTVSPRTASVLSDSPLRDDPALLERLRAYFEPRAAEVDADPSGFLGYEPFENMTGPDIVVYELCTKSGLCDTAIVDVDVVPADHDDDGADG